MNDTSQAARGTQDGHIDGWAVGLHSGLSVLDDPLVALPTSGNMDGIRRLMKCGVRIGSGPRQQDEV